MDLTTTYMGLKLSNPVVPSSSPLSYELDGIKRMAEQGAGAVVLYSLFEEQLKQEQQELTYYLERGTDSFAEALSYFPKADDYNLGPQEYLEHIRKAKQAVDIPIIASLNGISTGGWVDYARQIEQAGADALELNVYFIAAKADVSGSAVEQLYVDVLTAIKKHVSIPVAIKLGPYFSSIPAMLTRLDKAGANGLVLFNRFYQPDLDLEQLEVKPGLALSTEYELRLPLRWIAIMYGKLQADMAATTGIHTGQDALKAIMAGASVAMVCSAVLQHGPSRIHDILNSMRAWMAEKDYASVEQLRGVLSQKSCAEPAAFERANYVKTLRSWSAGR